jgi:membrane protein implicated in regulation of membrane protease activity
MDLYTVSLATGAVGLGIMGIGGFSHGAHGGITHGARGAHAHVGHGSAARGARAPGSATGWRWTSLLSPRLLFALMVGFGAGGIAATPLSEPWRLGVALLAATIFETLLVGPLWRFLFRFESQPATTLESAIEDEARAVTGFDANGNGLVSLEVDGQVVQLLATLADDERARGIRIHSGDLVRVAEVDAERGRCTVTLPTR